MAATKEWHDNRKIEEVMEGIEDYRSYKTLCQILADGVPHAGGLPQLALWLEGGDEPSGAGSH